MGTYFNPPEALPTVGRQLISSSDYRFLVRQLRVGEQLYGLYDRYIFIQARLLDSPSEFEEAEDQYRKGLVNRLGFYALLPNNAR